MANSVVHKLWVTLKAVAETMRKFISRVDAPLCARPQVRLLFFGDSIRGNMPHLGIGILNVLLHAEPGSPGLIFPISHGTELGEVCLDVWVRVFVSISLAGSVLVAALQLGLGVGAVAHVGLVLLISSLARSYRRWK